MKQQIYISWTHNKHNYGIFFSFVTERWNLAASFFPLFATLFLTRMEQIVDITSERDEYFRWYVIPMFDDYWRITLCLWSLSCLFLRRLLSHSSFLFIRNTAVMSPYFISVDAAKGSIRYCSRVHGLLLSRRHASLTENAQVYGEKIKTCLNPWSLGSILSVLREGVYSRH